MFDRMETDLKGKLFSWPTIVEYFTKRGRPLTHEDLKRLKEEDQRIADEVQAEIKKREKEDAD